MPSYKFTTLALFTYLALSVTASPIALEQAKRDKPLPVASLRPDGVPPIEETDGPSRGASGLPSQNFDGMADPPPPPADPANDPANAPVDNHGDPAAQPHGVGTPPVQGPPRPAPKPGPPPAGDIAGGRVVPRELGPL
ncbi:hypothetical protein ACLMJK_008714 [Lecanora helva]